MNKRLAIIGLSIIILMITLPIAFSNQLTGWGHMDLQGPSTTTGTGTNTTTGTSNSPSGPITINADIPGKVGDHRVDFLATGTTGTELKIYVNGEVKRTIFTFAGNMTIRNLPLPAISNTIRIVATLNNQTSETSATVEVDTRAPNVQIAIPPTATQSPLRLNGSTNKPVTLNYRITQGDNVLPKPVTELRAIQQSGAVGLSWKSSTEEDIRGYIVYRDNKLLATLTQTENLQHTYTDDSARDATEYTYEVAALDTGCNEGPRKAEASITTTSGGSGSVPIAQSLSSLDCGFTTVQVTGNFTLDLPVSTDGANKIEIKAEDDVGNDVEFEQVVTIDTEAPTFISTNLDRISPSYDPFVTIRGDVSEAAAVTILINGKPEKTINTDANGHFSTDITLPRTVSATVTDNSFGAESGTGWTNQISIVATDAAGNTATQGPTDVVYALCGEGNYYTVGIGEAIPSTLNPRLMLEGVQQLGFSFNSTYTGGYEVSLQNININTVSLSPSEREKYDNDRVTVTPVYQVDRSGNINGYAQINFREFDPYPNNKTATTFDREEAVSNRHKGDCLVPEAGCVRLRMIMETRFQEVVPAPIVNDPNRRTTLASTIPEPRVQKNCIDFEVAVDKRVPPSVVPNKLLETLSDTIGSIVEVMDKILKPLTTLGTYLIYACFASSATLFLLIINEKWSCDFNEATSVVTQSRWDKKVADAGLCEVIYDGADDESKEKKESCKSCQDAKERAKDFEEEVMRRVCDRVACPSAPTWQTHNKNSGSSVEDITSLVNAKMGDEAVSKWKQPNGKVYVGNDCAVKKEGDTVVFGRTDESYNSLLPSYKLQKGTGTETGSTGITIDDCKETMRPADPICCAEEYVEQWATACGVTSGSLDTFDELKESMCLAAQKQGKNDVEGSSCGSLWNSAAGFCEPESGAQIPELVRTGVPYEVQQASAVGNEPYLVVVPDKGSEPETYKVYIGYVTQRFQFDQRARNGNVTTAASPSGTGVLGPGQYINNTYLNSNLDITYRKDITNVIFNADHTIKNVNTAHSTLRAEVCNEAEIGKPSSSSRCDAILTNERSIALFNSVTSKVTVPDQQYIVRPDDGILRSLQCLCIPALTSWIARWRQILGILKTCIDTIRTTGDGSAGACEAFISQYACDLIYEALTCFTQKFGSPGGGTSITDSLPFGKVFGAITSAGTDMNRRVTNRYGDTGLYKTLFNDRKLANAVCLFAFTGTWNLDVNGLIQQSAATAPIPSQGMIQPCRRRFNGYDISTRPPGLANWIYNFGVVLIPGTDIRYSLELVCSEGFTCDPSDGFKNGECDCNRIGEKTSVIRPQELGTGTLKASDDPLNANVFFALNARQAQAQPNYRYDKAILKWESTDPKVTTPSLRGGQAECSIDLEGTDAPAFCSWDIFTSSFRCQFGFQTSTIQLKRVTPKYTNVISGTNIDVFGLNESMKFDLDVRQLFPSEPTDQPGAQKYLSYEIKNQDLKVVDKMPEANREHPSNLVLKRDGDYIQTVSIDGKLTKDNFKAPEAAASSQLIWIPGTPTGSTRTTSSPLITNFRLVGGQNSTLPAFVVLAFTQDSFKVFESDGQPTGTDRRWKRGAELTGNGDIRSGVRSNYRFDNDGKKYSLEFGLAQKPTELSTISQVDVLMPTGVRISERVDPCTGAAASKPVQWIATFTIHDGDQFGKPTNQISVDANTGEPATKTVAFNVICSTNVQPRSEATQTPGNRTTPTVALVPKVLSFGGTELAPLDGVYVAEEGQTYRITLDNPQGQEVTISYGSQNVTSSGTPVQLPVSFTSRNEQQADIQVKQKNGQVQNRSIRLKAEQEVLDIKVFTGGVEQRPTGGTYSLAEGFVAFTIDKGPNVNVASRTISVAGESDTDPFDTSNTVYISEDTSLTVSALDSEGKVVYVETYPIRIVAQTASTSFVTPTPILFNEFGEVVSPSVSNPAFGDYSYVTLTGPYQFALNVTSPGTYQIFQNLPTGVPPATYVATGPQLLRFPSNVTVDISNRIQYSVIMRDAANVDQGSQTINVGR